jgi:hypothetical protein
MSFYVLALRMKVIVMIVMEMYVVVLDRLVRVNVCMPFPS